MSTTVGRLLKFPSIFAKRSNVQSVISKNFASTVVQQKVEDEPDKLYKTIEIEMRANDPAAMKSYAHFTKLAANHLDIEVGKCWTPRKPIHEREGLCLLRSIHVNKKCRVQYEVRTYFRYVTFHKLTGSTADTFLEYIERNVPEGVALKITKVAIEKLPSEVSSYPNTQEARP